MSITTAIIVDDEALARQLIKKYLESYPHIHVVAECSDGFEAVKTIQQLHPQLVFLDVKMPKLSGFEVLEVLDCKPAVVFSTAHDEFALKAFEQNAIDYLLKPYSKDRFGLAVNKALEKIAKNEPQANIDKAREQVFAGVLERIVIKNGPSIKVLPTSAIHYIEAEDDYVMIYSCEGRFLKQQTMKQLETSLDPSQFLRVHRSFIVKIDQIKLIEPYEKDSFVLKLMCGATVSVSKTGFKKLKEELNF